MSFFPSGRGLGAGRLAGCVGRGSCLGLVCGSGATSADCGATPALGVLFGTALLLRVGAVAVLGVVSFVGAGAFATG